MRIIKIGANEDGQRLDRVLMRFMDKAPSSFIYRMLRKKNITLNGKKAEGGMRLSKGDEIRIFLSDTTLEGFMTHPFDSRERAAASSPYERYKNTVKTIYEDGDTIFFCKPAGMLSQKAEKTDYSLCEFLIDYMLESGQTDREALKTFRPGICNRLDRNTSGLVAAGKSLAGCRGLNELFRSRKLHKYYRAVAVGNIPEKRRIEGWLSKDVGSNLVKVYPEKKEGTLPICTEYLPLKHLRLHGREYTYLEINLITGRSHQIRAHLASMGHPICGDPKYGDREANAVFAEEYCLRYQLLHSFRMEIPKISGGLEALSGRTITAPLPEEFLCILADF